MLIIQRYTFYIVRSISNARKRFAESQKSNTDLLNYYFICLIIILPKNYFILSRHQLLDALKWLTHPITENRYTHFTRFNILSHHQLQDALRMAYPPHHWERIHPLHLLHPFQILLNVWYVRFINSTVIDWKIIHISF